MLHALAGLAWYASYDYKGCRDDADVSSSFENACGVSYEDFLALQLPEYPHGSHRGISRVLLYNDPLLGLVDKHIEAIGPTRPYYERATAALCRAAEGKGEFAPAFEVILRLSELLENKADFGVRLKAAYDVGDRDTLTAMCAECDTVTEKLQALKTAHRTAWMAYNKPFGFEVHDIRYGGLIARFETVKLRLAAYLAGELDRIEELEQERLRIDCATEDTDPISGQFAWIRYMSIATAGLLN